MTLYQIELLFDAEQDLDDIALYTLKEYGQKQQDLY